MIWSLGLLLLNRVLSRCGAGPQTRGNPGSFKPLKINTMGKDGKGLTKAEFKKRCEFIEYGKGHDKKNAIFYDWQVTEDGVGFKYMVKAHIKNATRKELFDEFSMIRFMAGLAQVAVVFCLLLVVWFLMTPDRGYEPIYTALGFAIVFQVMSLTLYMQGRK